MASAAGKAALAAKTRTLFSASSGSLGVATSSPGKGWSRDTATREGTKFTPQPSTVTEEVKSIARSFGMNYPGKTTEEYAAQAAQRGFQDIMNKMVVSGRSLSELQQQTREAIASEGMLARLISGRATMPPPALLQQTAQNGKVNKQPALESPNMAIIAGISALGRMATPLIGAVGGQLAKGGLASTAGKLLAGYGATSLLSSGVKGIEKATGWNIPLMGYSKAELAAMGIKKRHARPGFISKRGLKVIRRANSMKKQVSKAARMLGLFKTRRRSSGGVITAAEALAALSR